MILQPQTGDYSIAIGANNPDDHTNAPFWVKHNGEMKATNATITGNITATSGKIGGCTISDNVLNIEHANLGSLKIGADNISTTTTRVVTGISLKRSASAQQTVTFLTNTTGASRAVYFYNI